MTIKELYKWANANGFENLPLQYGFVDDNGIYYPDYFGFADFDYNPNNVTMMFYVAGDRELAKGLQENTGSTMEYVSAEYLCSRYAGINSIIKPMGAAAELPNGSRC